MTQLDSMDHVTITVSDIEQSVAWYTSSFACSVLLQRTTHALLQFENIKLTLVLPSQEQRHIAFQKQDAETYGELRTQRDGVRSTLVSDPTGNIVELIKDGSSKA